MVPAWIENVIDKISEGKFYDDEYERQMAEIEELENFKRKRPLFDIDDITGHFEMDELGAVIMNPGGLDMLDRRVNQKGYLIDSAGNVVN